MQQEITFLVQEDPDGGYVATALGHTIATQADDFAALKAAVREAVQCHFDDATRPKLIRLHYVRDEVIAA